jgi:GntR family transcriptional regulator
VPAALDRRSPLPLWAQLLEDLRRRLAGGEFDGRFPTDRELIEQYSASRHTVRHAVGRLCDEGLIERERGRGTFLAQRAIEQPLGMLYSLFRTLEDQGIEQRSIVLALDRRRDAAAAAMLGLTDDAPLVHLHRVRLADGEPLAVDWSWLPVEAAAPLLEVDFSRTALYSELAQRCGVQPTSGWERIQPVLADPDLCRLLDLGPGQALFDIERLALHRGTPIEWRRSVVRGDRYSFISRWDEHHHSSSSMEMALDVGR